ncbi:unnamed protein product [Leptosia nina]|uniref:C2H2-type domain-containing protein n=1 Tax=Leptosia nina TaxID=320188 RepID=A0AAV1JKC8_9NEOP
MSEEDQGSTSQGAPVVAEFKDGQLEIVEIEYENNDQESEGITYEGASNEFKMCQPLSCMQVVDTTGKSGVLDLLNMTLIKCYNEEGETYRLVSNNTECTDSETVTCILSSAEGDEQIEQQYMVVTEDNSEYLQSNYTESQPEPSKEESSTSQHPSPQWVLEKAKALQQSESLLACLQRRGRKGRRRKGELPPPHELLTSPTFKLYIYSCKMCTYKCNSIKELQAHKAAEHSSGNKERSGRNSSIALQCPKCPFRGHTHAQLTKHMQDNHTKRKLKQQDNIIFSEAINLDSDEVNAADVLVCGACGFESPSKDEFRKHIEEEHGATAC